VTLCALFHFIGTLVASTTTDSKGRIAFENMPRPGMYTIKEVTPGGFVDVGDSDGGDPNIISVPLAPGELLAMLLLTRRETQTHPA
jgi:hypothetical protein